MNFVLIKKQRGQGGSVFFYSGNGCQARSTLHRYIWPSSLHFWKWNSERNVEITKSAPLIFCLKTTKKQRQLDDNFGPECMASIWLYVRFMSRYRKRSQRTTSFCASVYVWRQSLRLFFKEWIRPVSTHLTSQLHINSPRSFSWDFWKNSLKGGGGCIQTQTRGKNEGGEGVWEAIHKNQRKRK